MNEEIFYFEKLTVWQHSRKLVKDIYELSDKFPVNERYGLADQLRRAAVSVSSNIAESSGRIGSKDRLRFLNFAYGSLMEVRCQLVLAEDLNYISSDHNKQLAYLIIEISRMLSSMREKLSNE